MKKRKLLSLIMAICMVLSLVPTVAFADGGASPVQIEVKNAQNGITRYKVGDGEWIDLNTSQVWDIDGASNGDTVTVCAIPNPGQELDGAEFRVNGMMEFIDNTALQTESGWSFTYTESNTYQVYIEYRNGGDPNPPVEPNPVNPGEFRFFCQSNTITGGSIYYKLNNSEEFVKVSEENDKYESITLTDEDTSIAIRFVTNEEYQVDTTRGVTLRVNGMDEFRSTEENIGDFTSESGYTFNLSELVSGSVSSSNFELEFGFGNAGGGDPNPPVEPNPVNPGELSFTCQDYMITGGSIYYKLNNSEEFVKVSEENDKYESITLTDEDTSISIRFVANEEYQVDTTRGVTLRVNGMDKFSSTEENIGDFTSESGYTFNLSELVSGSVSLSNFELEFGFEDAGGGIGPEPGDEPAHGGYEGEPKTAFVTVAGKADFYINDSRMVNGNNGDSFDDVDYHYDGEGYVDFYFNCFIGERITVLKINGEDYYNELPKPGTEEGKAALLAACKGQLNEFKITVPYSESGYEIESNVKWLGDDDKDYMVVGNFLWTYEDENQGDDYIDHGIMELLGVNYGGKDYSPEELNNPGTAFDWGQDENGGSAVLPVGAVVTVKLVPDYGYQLTSFGINGGDFGTGDEQATFTFVIKPGNAHLGACFTPVADKVKSSSDTVTGGNIELVSGLSGGSAQLEISDAKNELSDEKLEAFDTAAGNYTITNYLNLDLYNVYYKGSTDADDVWKNEVNTLDIDATVSVSLADSPLEGTVNSSDIVIIHNIHNGEDFETIPIDSYDSKTNTITFKTDSFSTYAISIRVNTVHTHKMTHVYAKNSTCKAAGNKEYWICSGCKKVYADAAGKTETSVEKMTIAVIGHKWDKGSVTKAATATKKGVKTYKCTVCGITKTETIPATGVPKKGTKIKHTKSAAYYKVTDSNAKNPTVAYIGTTKSTAKTVTIPATITVDGITYKVTAIADGALNGNKTVTKVTILKNVKTIGKNAFNGCTKLKTVTIGSGVTSIGANAFKGCKVLDKITIPNKVTTIGSNAFNGCTKLKTVTLSSGVTTIGAGAFKNCKTLAKITLPSKTTKIGSEAFYGCTKLNTITIKSKKMTGKTISKNAFKGISKNVTIKVPSGKAKAYKTLFRNRGLSKKVKVK